MEKRGLLEFIWTGYPLFKLRDEVGIPHSRIKSYPWVHSINMANKRFGLIRSKRINRKIEWLACELIDKYVASEITSSTVLIALSSMGLHAGIKTQQLGGYYICDRGSSHIRFQNELLIEEYARWGFSFEGINPQVIKKEELEYEVADKITVPSEFAKKSFMRMGVSEAKISKIIYGANFDRFFKIADPPKNCFRVFWVGELSIRKGFMYLYEAFQMLKHPRKELLVVGAVTPEIKKLLASKSTANITFLHKVANKDLALLYSTSHVFVLPSIEEGMAMVQGEALACGCPVIATTNTGSEDLFKNGVEGYIIPIRSPNSIKECLQQLVDNHLLQSQMSEAATQRVKQINGWDRYGEEFSKLIASIN
ncbi:glycosyltransferase family 4 protein [Spirosoma foliorum]|nr:glycosyltransferase family 4 protein [Spirosoma foliorum]